MRTVKEYLELSFFLIVYIIGISILLQQFYMYQKAYQSLSSLISHPTVLAVESEEEDK